MGNNRKLKQTVIVTGNAGFVGRYLTRALLKKGYFVIGFDLVKTKDELALKHKHFQQKKVNLCQEDSVLHACKSIKKVNFIFHTVAIQPIDNSMDIKEYLAINLNGSSNLINACAECGFKNLIVSSSFSVYGKPQYLPIDENHPTQPINIYGLSKLLAEKLFEFYARTKEFHITILRYDGIYGTGQTIPGFIQYLMDACTNDEEIELFHNGRQKRDNVYVEDVVQSNIKAMSYNTKNQLGVFNIGGGEPKTSYKTASTVQKVLKSKAIIINSPRTSPMGYDIYMTSMKAESVLGYSPKKLEQNIKSILKENCQ